MSYFKVCPLCGANLDPGEVCDCTLTVSASDKMSENAEEKMQVCGGEEEKKIDSQ